MSSLAGKAAIITGGASGIGLAISEAFARAGASVAIFDFDKDAGVAAADKIKSSGHSALSFSCDISDAASIQKALKETIDAFGGVDILVNNAGVANIGTATTTAEDDFDRVMNVNVKGVYQCLKEVLPVMMESGGGVVLNMSSIAAITALKDRFAYSASKGAVHTMTYSVATDYLEHGIRCNSICPARVHTPFVDGYLEKNYPENKDEMFEKLSKVQPLGRMAKPEEIAKMALYLCSDDSSYITGQSFNIDGGYLNLRV
ncbi:MAG: SDR family NAD(P)-dependent oxidoreductase [Verrucomicrobiales bacterium]|nr:SDR family NAD(P)-dependent oxidoreductase [Verrucomicrobiales bacterium]